MTDLHPISFRFHWSHVTSILFSDFFFFNQVFLVYSFKEQDIPLFGFSCVSFFSGDSSWGILYVQVFPIRLFFFDKNFFAILLFSRQFLLLSHPPEEGLRALFIRVSPSPGTTDFFQSDILGFEFVHFFQCSLAPFSRISFLRRPLLVLAYALQSTNQQPDIPLLVCLDLNLPPQWDFE